MSQPVILLLSGGVDSAALAFWLKPSATLFIDYGQRPRNAERRAARAIAQDVGLRHAEIAVDMSSLGMGLLSTDDPSSGPSPEWWPFRNQMLVTIAAGWAIKTARTDHCLVLGAVAGDGDRHLDGRSGFYRALDLLLQSQEGGIRVDVPAINIDALELIRASGAPPSLLSWSHSCHRSDIPCLTCPGCNKHTKTFEKLAAE